MITDVIQRIICFWSQRSTFQRPRKLPEAMRKLVGSSFLGPSLQLGNKPNASYDVDDVC